MVLTKADIQRPVQLVLNLPVVADMPAKVFGVPTTIAVVQARDEIVTLTINLTGLGGVGWIEHLSFPIHAHHAT